MKWNNKYLVAFITSFLGIGVLSWYLFSLPRHDQYRVIGGAFVMVAELAIFLVTGLVLVFFPKTKSFGQGIFIGAAVTLVIGFGVCTATG
jgi:hypothetical protein